MAKKQFDPHIKEHMIAGLRTLKALFEMAEAFEISGKMLLFLPAIVVLVGLLKITDIFPDGSEKALKLLLEDSNLTRQVIKKLEEHIKKLGG